MNTAKTLLALLLITSVIGGCRSSGSDPGDRYNTVAPQPGKDSEAARALNAEGARLMREDRLEEAEAKLKAAAAADTGYGPAHNTLGTLYYRQKRHYLAAWEFQYAMKLMPEKAEPRNNLGLVYESVGRIQDAARQYEEALKLNPKSVEIAANLARTYVRMDRKDAETRRLLKEVVVNDSRREWVAWAWDHLMLMGERDNSAPEPGKKE